MKLWAGEKTHPEMPGASLALAACRAVMFFSGLRPQEARAVHLDQLIKRLSVLLVTRSMDGEGATLHELE